MTSHESEVRRGTLYGAAAYLLWGVFPLYFPLLEPAGAIEILLHRVVWSLLVCVVVLLVLRGWRQVADVARSPRRMALLGVAAAVIAVNWGVYIYGVNSGQVVQASLGYFVNPVVTVLLGVLVLRETLRPGQWAAVGIGVVAVAVLTVDYGGLPWIALALAFSFAFYGLVKNRVGRGVGALTSLTAETALLAPAALGVLVWMEVSGRGTLTSEGSGHALLLASTGLVTAVPLLFFAAAARRVPLTTIGLLQYLAPVLQFAVGVLVYREAMPPSRWAGFALVWLALVVLTVDTLRSSRHRARRLARAAEAAAA
ncbi:MAG: EamA family transporter RarD [Actinomycetota bacterium]